jgi:hypothetical protein
MIVFILNIQNTTIDLSEKIKAQEATINEIKNLPNSQTGTTDNGTQGLAGTQGLQGPKGDTGAQGPQGLPGTQGIQGAQGAVGLSGPSGTPGTNGVSGYQVVNGSSWTTVSSKAQGTAYLSCPSGKKAVGVSCYTNSGSNDVFLRAGTIYINGTGGSCNYYNGYTASIQVSIMLTCITAN